MKKALTTTSIYFLTVLIGQIASFLLLPIVTGYLDASLYGEYALALAISGLVATLGSSWISNVSFRLYFDARDKGETRSFFWTVSLLRSCFFSLIYSLVVAMIWFTASKIAAFQAYQVISLETFFAAGLFVVVSDFFQFNLSLLRAEKESSPFIVASLGDSILRFAGTAAGLAIGFRTPSFLLYAAAAGNVLPLLFALGTVRGKLKGKFFVNFGLIKYIFTFGPSSLPFSVGVWFERLADRLILQFFTSTAVVGVYSAGYSIAERILGGVNQAIFMMAWPDILSAWSEKGKEAAREAISRSIKMYALLTLGPMLFIIVFRQELTGLLLRGQGYADAAQIIPVIIIGVWLSGFKTYLNRHYELNKRYAPMSIVIIIGAVINVTLNFILIPRFSAMGAATATLINYIVISAIFFFLRNRELIKLPWLELGLGLGLSGLAWLGSVNLTNAYWGRPALFILIYLFGLAAYTLWFWRRFKRKRALRTSQG